MMDHCGRFFFKLGYLEQLMAGAIWITSWDFKMEGKGCLELKEIMRKELAILWGKS